MRTRPFRVRPRCRTQPLLTQSRRTYAPGAELARTGRPELRNRSPNCVRCVGSRYSFSSSTAGSGPVPHVVCARSYARRVDGLATGRDGARSFPERPWLPREGLAPCGPTGYGIWSREVVRRPHNPEVVGEDRLPAVALSVGESSPPCIDLPLAWTRSPVSMASQRPIPELRIAEMIACPPRHECFLTAFHCVYYRLHDVGIVNRSARAWRYYSLVIAP